jgi:hypothetical protein
MIIRPLAISLFMFIRHFTLIPNQGILKPLIRLCHQYAPRPVCTFMQWYKGEGLKYNNNVEIILYQTTI